MKLAVLVALRVVALAASVLRWIGSKANHLANNVLPPGQCTHRLIDLESGKVERCVSFGNQVNGTVLCSRHDSERFRKHAEYHRCG